MTGHPASLSRRRVALALSLLPLARGAGAQTAGAPGWPSRPVKLIVGFPPGGGIDFTARTLQPALEAALGQPVVIDYKPGAGGVIAAAELTRAPPDGYTLLVANTGPFAIAPYLQAKPPYDPARQFTYLGQIAETAYIAAARTDHPARDLRQFVEWARAHPSKAHFASGGPGSSTHLNGELLAGVAGVELMHVPYKGSAPAVTDLIGGQVQLLIDAGTVLLPHIKSGRLKALAVTGPRRDPALPDVPTVREQGLAAMENAGFQGLVGPPGLPPAVVERLSAALQQALAGAEVRSRFAGAGAEVQPRGSAEFAAHVRAEAERWSALIARRGIKVD